MSKHQAQSFLLDFFEFRSKCHFSSAFRVVARGNVFCFRSPLVSLCSKLLLRNQSSTDALWKWSLLMERGGKKTEKWYYATRVDCCSGRNFFLDYIRLAVLSQASELVQVPRSHLGCLVDQKPGQCSFLDWLVKEKSNLKWLQPGKK